ncbi:ROK family protein [Clostridium neonatale]|uniref:ROK family protein n=1 Tax=Clostridium neonatale TaxID=137838 RepID=UPI003CC7C436
MDISITTVSTNISELKKIGIVEDVRSLESTGGRKAMAIKLNENCQYGLGIALTPRHVKLSLINLRSEDVELLRIRHDNNSIEDIINIVSYNIQSLLEKNNVKADQLLGIGISIPGTVDTQNGIIKNCYLLNIKDFNIKEKFEYLNVPIYVDNEANLSAYYEYLNKKILWIIFYMYL